VLPEIDSPEIFGLHSTDTVAHNNIIANHILSISENQVVQNEINSKSRNEYVKKLSEEL